MILEEGRQEGDEEVSVMGAIPGLSWAVCCHVTDNKTASPSRTHRDSGRPRCCNRCLVPRILVSGSRGPCSTDPAHIIKIH
jgi:hypothetical protein